MRAIETMLQLRLDAVRDRTDGEVASYIPALSEMDPDLLGAAIGGARGRIASAGDDGAVFTIQSVSKPFILAQALEEFGREHVLRVVGVEPSGEPFNAISLEPGTGRPANPMQNAGAIATTGLMADAFGTDGVITALERFAGRALEVDERVYASERATGHRNRALGHLLRSYEVIDGDVDAAVTTYFRQCSVRVTVRDLAVMATTMAFGGVNPVTGARVVSESVARDVMSIMASCGMYDYSGEWMLRVGVPAKSGISGAVLATAPSQFGVAAFSPRLDRHGNSVRAVALLESLSRGLGMHAFEQHEGLSEPRIRVREVGDERVLVIGGQLTFSSVGRVLVMIEEELENGRVVTVELRRPRRVHPAALEALTCQAQLSPGRVRIVPGSRADQSRGWGDGELPVSVSRDERDGVRG